jgi:MFS family permease
MIGVIIAFQAGGVLAASSWGWPSIFWGTGAFCLIMFTVVTTFTTATPSEHKFISEEEKNFILGSTDSEVKKVCSIIKVLFSLMSMVAHALVVPVVLQASIVFGDCLPSGTFLCT